MVGPIVSVFSHLFSKEFFLFFIKVHLCLILGSYDFFVGISPSPLKLYPLFFNCGANDFIVRHGVPTMPT